MTRKPGPPEGVEAYLDRMFDLLAGTGAAGRRALSEVEDHLRESARDGVASGLSEADAERAAVDRFGPPERVASGLVGTAGTLGVAVRRLFSSAVLLGCVGLVAIGVSGLVAAALGGAFGKPFVSGDPPGVTYTAARCADFLEYHPEARTCAAAATAHHFDEVVQYRVAAGVLGLIGLLVYGVLRRTRPFAGLAWAPRADLVGVVGAGAFGVAMVVLGGGGLAEAASGLNGAGQLVSAGLVSLVGCVAFLPLVVRTLRGRAGVT
jgi:hypothetical protein